MSHPSAAQLLSIRPIDAPEGSLTVTRSDLLPVVPIIVGKNGLNWEITKNKNGTFNIAGGPQRYKWINIKNALFATRVGSGDEFDIKSVFPGIFVIGIPSQDLLLTYNVETKPELTFKPVDGTSAQRFQFIAGRPGLEKEIELFLKQ